MYTGLRAFQEGDGYVAMLHESPLKLGDKVYVHVEKLVKDKLGRPRVKKQLIVAEGKVTDIQFSKDGESKGFCYEIFVAVSVPVYERDGVTKDPVPKRMLLKVSDSMRLWWDQSAAIYAL